MGLWLLVYWFNGLRKNLHINKPEEQPDTQHPNPIHTQASPVSVDRPSSFLLQLRQLLLHRGPSVAGLNLMQTLHDLVHDGVVLLDAPLGSLARTPARNHNQYDDQCAATGQHRNRTGQTCRNTKKLITERKRNIPEAHCKRDVPREGWCRQVVRIVQRGRLNVKRGTCGDNLENTRSQHAVARIKHYKNNKKQCQGITEDRKYTHKQQRRLTRTCFTVHAAACKVLRGDRCPVEREVHRIKACHLPPRQRS